MSKNIIIFSDGTCQKGGEGANTNIYKLFNIIEDRTANQIAYYDPGVGTDWRKISGSISGRGLSQNILDCYRFIFENYEAGDQIYLFGFSRGAATVRSLSSLIHHFGILPKSRPDLIEEAFKIYKKSGAKTIDKNAKAFIAKHHTMWTKVKFIGVFDTVAALGFPVKWMSVFLDKIFAHRFHDFKLSDCIENARQALSINDERKTFHPIYWSKNEEANQTDKVKQVFFCGVHTDVGGGYEEEDLSNISLKWMLNEAVSKGLIVFEQSDAYQHLLKTTIQPNGMMHTEQKGVMGKIYRRALRTWDKEQFGKLCVHRTVLMRVNNQENKTTPVYSPWVKKYLNENNPCIEN